jgi:hypothetical protein
MVELIYNAGYRGGEAYAADAASVYPQDRQIAVNWQALSLPGLPTRQARPKHGRTRTTNYPDVTLTGFALHDALGERLERIDWEHTKGRNPKRLLFPAPQGGWWWASTFSDKYFNVAAAAAGWEARTWVDEHGRHRRLWVHTAHSLRHRFARDRIDTYDHEISELQAVGGWQSAQVVWERYYGQSSDLLARSGAKLRRPSWSGPSSG